VLSSVEVPRQGDRAHSPRFGSPGVGAAPSQRDGAAPPRRPQAALMPVGRPPARPAERAELLHRGGGRAPGGHPEPHARGGRGKPGEHHHLSS